MYPWVGRLEIEKNNELAEAVTSYGTNLFIQSTDNSLTIGGGGEECGLVLNDNLTNGFTGCCKTFDNNPLTGDKSKDFDIYTVEVFGFR